MSREISYIKIFFIMLFVIITSLLIIFVYNTIQSEYETADNFAIIEAKAAHNKDILYRRWATKHGGVYVPIADHTPPNPYLSHIPNRDILDQNGRKLTLVNPAYMTRHVFEMGELQYGVKAHITSLNPIRKENKADAWESKTLQMFEKGIIEYSSKENISGSNYLRYMKSMIVEKGCLKCHEQQGYKVGDIRGGISVSVPLKSYYDVAQANVQNHLIFVILAYFSFLGLGFFSYRVIIKEIKVRNLLHNTIAANESKVTKLYKDLLLSEEETKTINNELLIAKEKAEESDRLKTAFLQNITHEIRTPLNGIMGFSKLLLLPDLSQEEVNEYTDLIIKSGDRLLETVNNILDMALIQTKQLIVKKVNFDLNGLIYDQFELFNNIATSKGLTLKYYCQNEFDEIIINADPIRMNQILNNLISNSIKFTIKGEIEYGYKIKDNFYEFFVSDTGIGIFTDLKDRIFTKFTQLENSISRSYEGNGLGLPICKGLVELHGGKIWYDSNIRKGTTFYFTIPF